MIALALMVFSALLFQAFLNAAVVLLQAQSSLILLAPVVVVVAVFCLDIYPALWALMIIGMILDSLTGNLFGFNMVLLVFLGAVAMLISRWLGKAHWPMIILFLLATSLVYRLVLLPMGGWTWIDLLFGPVLDLCVGFLVLYSLPSKYVFFK